jgi:hypothetical protein
MVIYELDRKARENGYSGEESCVTCGVYAITGGETHWAYEGYDILGWICDDCYEGGYVYMRERLREQARALHAIACGKDRLANNDIQYARQGAPPLIR